tara:strand:+ start:404 stop:595 length:192 start_codon:yes stop_codon:yes gene_type:complete
MESFLEIGHPDIPTPNGLPSGNDGNKILLFLLMGTVVVLGVLYLTKNNSEKPKPKEKVEDNNQ